MAISNYLRASASIAAILGAALLGVLFFYYSSFASAQVSTAAAPGTTITVNTEEDESNTDGDCALREAIQAANTNFRVDRCAGGSATQEDEIHFALGKRATIVLGSALPTITDAAGLTINAQKKKITVSGNDSVRVFRVNSGAKLDLSYLTVADGFSPSPDATGGGLRNDGGTVTVSNSTFSNNTAGGTNQAALGGGIRNDGTLTVTNSTFSGNTSTATNVPAHGGAIGNVGTLTITNSTFSGNHAETGGGGIANLGTLTVTNSTFSEHSTTPGSSSVPQGAVILNSGAGTVSIRNTIVANTTQGINCSGTITDGGYNIEDDTTCGFSAANNSMPSTNPLLDPNGLANNGGPTQTIKLLKASPAMNAIPRAENGCSTDVTRDQRGVRRPQGSGCEVGAFEKKVRRR